MSISSETYRKNMDLLLKLIHDMQIEIGDLKSDLKHLQRRFNQLHPERHYCAKCKAIVHKDAVSCSCGYSWGREPDPKAGLPR